MEYTFNGGTFTNTDSWGGNIVQELGNSEDKIISQKGISKNLNNFGQDFGHYILINQSIDAVSGVSYENNTRASFISLLKAPFIVSIIDTEVYEFISLIRYNKKGEFVDGIGKKDFTEIKEEDDNYQYNITIKRKDDGIINDLKNIIKFSGAINISISDMSNSISDINNTISDISGTEVLNPTLSSVANKYAIFVIGQDYSLSDDIDKVNASHTVVECREKDNITYTTTMYSAIDLIGFLNSDNKVISVVKRNSSGLQTVQTVAPSGAVKMIVNRQIQMPYTLTINRQIGINTEIDSLQKSIVEIDNKIKKFGEFDYALQNNLGAIPITGIIYDYNIILTYGQSLAVGNGIQTLDTNSPDNCYMLGNNPFADGTDKSEAILNRLHFANSADNVNFVPAISATAAFASIANRYGYNDKKFIAVGGGYAGYTVAQLMDTKRYVEVNENKYHFEGLTGADNQVYQRVISDIERIKEIADEEGKSVGVIAVAWIQGEGDYWGNNTPAEDGSYSCRGNKDEWKARVLQLKSDFNEDFNKILQQKIYPAWFIHNIQGGFIAPSFTINKAQIELCDNISIFSLQPVYQLPNVMDQHLTGNGYRWYGEIIAQCFYDVLICNKEPQCITVIKSEAYDKKIILYLKVPIPPLQTNKTIGGEVKDLGFYVTANNTKINIDTISVKSNFIIITTKESLSGKVIIEYATRNSEYTDNSDISDTVGSNGIIAGSGNICDSAIIHSYLVGAEDRSTEKNPVEYTPNLQNTPYDLRHFLKAFKIELDI